VTSGGLVSVKSVIDRETDASFSFLLVAVDGGTPALTSSASVTVTVSDVNDNAPVFTQTYYNMEVRDGANTIDNKQDFEFLIGLGVKINAK
jgi:hypothetical protein